MSPRTLGGADGPDADVDFWRWASSRGVVAVRCESRDVAEGWRGIVATEDIERDAVVLRVPGALLMSARSMNEDTQLCDAFRAHDSSAGAGLTPADKLTVHLLREASKGRDSRWHTYISRLPRAYNLLCVWTRRERAMLQDPRAIAVAERARQATRTSWRRALRDGDRARVLQHRPLASRPYAQQVVGSRESRDVFVPWRIAPLGRLAQQVHSELVRRGHRAGG